MWPKIAKSFHIEIAEQVPMSLSIYIADKGSLWADMTKKYGLTPLPYEQIFSWPFGDFIFQSGFDNITSTMKDAGPISR